LRRAGGGGVGAGGSGMGADRPPTSFHDISSPSRTSWPWSETGVVEAPAVAAVDPGRAGGQ
jgi:hypothetical protein